jgi:hypothetical protein
LWQPFAAAVILLARPSTTAVGRWSRRGLITIAGLTGVVTCFLLPLFLVKARRSRTREDRWEASLVAGGTLLQGAVFLGSTGARARFDRLDVSPFLSLIDLVLQPIVGLELFAWPTIQRWDGALVPYVAGLMPGAGPDLPRATLVLAIIVLTSLVVVVAVPAMRRPDARCTWIAAASLAILSVAGSVEMAGSPRYAFAPASVGLIGLAQAALDRSSRWRRAIASALVALLVGSNLWFFRQRVYFAPELPSWPDEVRSWRADPSYQPRIWPQFEFASWRVALPKPTRR